MILSANMFSTTSTPQNLLNDVGKFLGGTLVGEKLSPRAETQRLVLLRRLQPHLQRPKDTRCISLEEYEELPVHTAHSPSPSPSSGRSDDVCQVNLSFSETKSKALKHGPLLRREKGVFLDQWRKYATVLHRHILCMYSSEQGVKPYASVNIQGFIARPVPNPNNEPKKNSVFEIVCPGKTGYQFTARTVKDMNQWVAAICQASVQYVQVSHSPLSGVTTDKFILTEVQNVSATVYNEEEIYDDAGPVTNFNENAEHRLSDEDYYDDVSIVPEGNGRLESKPDCEVAPDKTCPPLPPRRLTPAVSQDGLSDQESVYDDIGVSKHHSQYSNVVGVDGGGRKLTEIRTSTILNWSHKSVQPGTGKQEEHKTLQPNTDKEGAHTNVQPGTNSEHTMTQPQQSEKHKMQYNAEENNDKGKEEIYDDIEHGDESPETKKSPVSQKKYSVTNGGGIKNRAKELEKFLFQPGCQLKHNTSNQKELDMTTLQKPMKNNGKDTLSSLPQMPAASQNSKSDIFDQPLQPTNKLHKPNKTAAKITTVTSSNIPLSKQPPELPPRSYLKR